MLKITRRIKEAMRKYFRRKHRVNVKIKSTMPAFRVIVNKSNMFIKAQVVAADGRVVCYVSDKDIKGSNKTERAMKAGEVLASLMKQHGIEKAVFDRNGYLYHGRVKAFAEGIRAGGIVL